MVVHINTDNGTTAIAASQIKALVLIRSEKRFRLLTINDSFNDPNGLYFSYPTEEDAEESFKELSFAWELLLKRGK